MKWSDGLACSRLAVIALTLAGNGMAAQAATPLYWPGGDMGYDGPLYDQPYEQPRRRVVRQPRMPKEEAAKAEAAAKGSRKPTGPLLMAISIEHQTMKVYDSNGLFAETPISSGMKGHATPMGVFSVIQKNKWHRSNIYSAAPMPFMQRLTWSGIALHAGVVPGHPASHGCVRMPMAFAVKMWSWTRMGARVVITPGEISPASFAHPLLASLRQAPPAAPMAAAPAVPSIKTTDALPATGTKTADASGNLVGATVSDVAANPVAATAKTAAAPAATDAPAGTGKPVAALPVTLDKAADQPAATDAAPAVRRSAGPIAIFVSRKDARLYVRQNFTPLFDVPVTISGDQPLGTHVFTAFTDKDASKPVHWTVLTLPASSQSETQGLPRRHQAAGAVVPTPAVMEANATDALNRLKLPDDLASRIGDQLINGSSLVVSDQGITASGETGKGTDFIIRLR